MNFNTLQYFMDIVELKSFTKAADRNYVAQTALSHAVAKLEQELEVQLLIRAPGGVSATEAGKVFYRECKEILDIHRRTLGEIEKLKPQEQHIRIGFIDIYECVEFMNLQRKLEQRFPGCHFEWVDRYSVPEEQLDLTIGYECEPKLDGAAGSMTVRVGKADLCCLVSTENVLAREERVRREAFSGQTLVVLIRDRSIHTKKYEKSLRQKYLKNIPCKIRFAYSALERRTLVECDAGIAVFEKNIFKYDSLLCRTVGILDCYDIRYYISYRDHTMKKIAEEIKKILL